MSNSFLRKTYPSLFASVPEDVFLLGDLSTIRSRCEDVYQQTKKAKGLFVIHEDRIETLESELSDFIINRYGKENIPPHDRWQHFLVLGNEFTVWAQQQDLSTLWDLIIVSVLSDAGSGALWSYWDQGSQKRWTRSEGLAVASFRLFQQGLFSSDPNQPYRVDAKALQQLRLEDFAQGMQSTKEAPLVGIEERFFLFKRLGDLLDHHRDWRELQKLIICSHPVRPSDLLNVFSEKTFNANDLFFWVRWMLKDLWPVRYTYEGYSLGDCWSLTASNKSLPRALEQQDLVMMVPFHKLTQWLVYSLGSAAMRKGWKGTGWESLTGLPEYRNGGLFLDSGVLVPIDPDWKEKTYEVSDPFIVQWRALTVVLLDQLHQRLCRRWQRSVQSLTLTQVLEGGTWALGRVYAQRYREGQPPVRLHSDGTVF